jgi:formylmethanofuran dehydrogenase subunit B
VIGAVTCLGCGCACDDIEIILDGGRIAEARGACELGTRWFGDGRVPSRALVDGQDASMDACVAAIARQLQEATSLLVYLAPDLSCEAQREAIAIADRLRARVESVTSSAAMHGILAAQERGRAGATLGEIRNRADVMVFWGVDPAVAYPRYVTRYAPDPVGVHVPRGRADRLVIAVDVGDARGPADADRRVSVAPALEVATLTAARAGAGDLAAWLRSGKYVVIVADGEAMNGDRGRADALNALAQSLNDHTRCALSVLRGGGNRSGADACLTWQTGYPAAVDFSRGVPRYRPHDRVEPDVVLVAGAWDRVPAGVAQRRHGERLAIIGPRASAHPSAFAIDTGVAGIHEDGTAIRMDDVPLPVRRVVPGPPTAREVLQRLRVALAGAAP